MLDSVRTYVYDRRWRLTKAASVAGGVYLCGRYVLDRIRDAREAVMQEKQARDHLRRRFRQNREDATYSIMTLLPTLGERILQEMDVEGITQELQARARQRTQLASSITPAIPRAPPSAPSESSFASSVEFVHDHEARSDVGSVAPSISPISEIPPSLEGRRESGSVRNGESTLSWVDQLSISNPSPSPSQLLASPGPSQHIPITDTAVSPTRASDSAEPVIEFNLSDSMMTSSSAVVSAIGDNSSSISEPSLSAGSVVHSEAEVTTGLTIRSKAELWKEVKMLTFTRTLTILYSTTLLCLFTTVQLAILGRHKYVQAVLEQAIAEQMPTASSGSLEDLLQRSMRKIEYEQMQQEAITEEVEMVYLTLSWWLLHVGWKDVEERVRRGVEEVFESVSLKTKVGLSDLFRLFEDVRSRVEHEVTFEGQDRRVDFISALLPPTTETLNHVLTQGGVPLCPASTLAFQDLLKETRSTISSPDFARVLEVALSRAMSTLFGGLEKNVFVESGGGDNAGEIRLRLAGLLPGLARWGHLAFAGLPNELVEGITGTRETSALSAIIFSKFEELFSQV